MNTFETDSGIFIRAEKEGDPTRTGYQVNINNVNKEFGTGNIVNRVKRTVTVPEKIWHSYEITANGDLISVLLDGKRAVETRNSEASVGFIGLQFVKAADIEFRNIRLRPLGLKSIFNGKDLTGWDRVDRTNVKAPPEWSARDGLLHVEKGPGLLETSEVFSDFILQLDIRANAGLMRRMKTTTPTAACFSAGTREGSGPDMNPRFHASAGCKHPMVPIM